MTPDKARTFQTAHRNIDVPTVEERRRDTAHAEDLAGVLVKEATDHRRRSGRLRQSHRDVKRASTPSGSSRTCCTAASGFSNSPLLCRVSRSPRTPQRAGYPSSARCSQRRGHEFGNVRGHRRISLVRAEGMPRSIASCNATIRPLYLCGVTFAVTGTDVQRPGGTSSYPGIDGSPKAGTERAAPQPISPPG